MQLSNSHIFGDKGEKGPENEVWKAQGLIWNQMTRLACDSAVVYDVLLIYYAMCYHVKFHSVM